MTDEEHMARAILLGRVYDWRDHTYSFLGGSPEYPRGDGLLDADTLEPISTATSNDRLHENNNVGKDWRVRS